MLGLGKDGEGVLRHVVLDRGAEHGLKSPDARIVVGRIQLHVADVSRVEVEGARGGVVEAMLLGELDEVGRSHIVGLVVRVIGAEAALIAGHEIHILGHAAGQPPVARSRLEVPYLALVHEADAEALRDAILLDQAAQTADALACRTDVGQDDVEDRVLSQTVLHQRVNSQRLLTAEDALRGAHTHARRVIPSATPAATQVTGCERGVTQRLAGQFAAEAAVLGHKLLRSLFAVLIDLQILGEGHVPILRPGQDHRPIGRHATAYDHGRTL